MAPLYNNLSNPYSTINKSQGSGYNKLQNPYKPTSTPVIPYVSPKPTATAPKPMSFTPEQTVGLSAAMARRKAGTATPDDLKNLTYAESNGFKPAVPVVPTATPIVAPPAPTTSQGGTINPATGGVTNTPPVIPQQQAVTDAEAAYRANLGLSAGEQSTQKELDTLNESYKTAYQNENEVARPLEFITGTQRALENRKINLSEPLNAKLARLQAQRLSALESSKFALDRADNALKTYQSENAPQQVSGSESIIKLNPTTGQYETVYSPPGSDPKAKLDAEMVSKGYSYVNTPKLRDDLKKQGYEIVVDPSGRTYAKPGKNTGKVSSNSSSTNSSGITPAEQKKIDDLVNAQRDKLAKGGSWGEAFDTIKNRYPGIDNAYLDELLNKGKYYTQTGNKSGRTL